MNARIAILFALVGLAVLGLLVWVPGPARRGASNGASTSAW